MDLIALFSDPTTWAALITLIVLEVVLALAFLVMIGLVLIADGFGFHVPKGYIYAAMAFSGSVEGLSIWQRARRDKLRAVQTQKTRAVETGDVPQTHG